MAVFNFTKSFFFPKDEDGNISLSTVQQRIEQALLNLKTPEDYIELEDGTKCFSKNELEKALFTEKPDKHKKNPQIKWGVDKVVLLIVAILFFALSILCYYSGIDESALELIAAVLGIIVPFFLLKKTSSSKQWAAFFKLIIVCSSLNLLASVISYTTLPEEISQAVMCIGHIFLIVGCGKIYKAQKKFVAAVPFLLLIIPCVFYIVDMILMIIDIRFFRMSYAMPAIKFGLVAICSFIVFINPAILSSSERYKYGFKSWLVLLIATALTVAWSISEYNRYQDLLEYIDSRIHYKDVREALQNGDIDYGMSYSEIENMCGPADYLSRRNGVVEHAYYGNVQLCFIDGRFYAWNDH